MDEKAEHRASANVYASKIQAAWKDLTRRRDIHNDIVVAAMDEYTIYIDGDSYSNIEEHHAEELWSTTQRCLYSDDSSIKFKDNCMQLYACEGDFDSVYQKEWLCTISYEQLVDLMGEARIQRIIAEERGYKGLWEKHGAGCSSEINRLAQCLLGGRVFTIHNPDVLHAFAAWLTRNAAS